MPNNLLQLYCVLQKRADLAEKYRQQFSQLHDDRNRTAGEIYENTKCLEKAAADLVNELMEAEYAASWIERWQP